VMLIAVLLWFKVFNLTFNDDKLLFLLGKLSPKISLLVSSALRFLPLFKRQAEKLSATQKAMGLFAENTWTDKLRSAMRVYSALITWALENAIDTGSSMKARGYGLKGRSNFSNFTFRASDAVLTAVISAADAIIIAVMAVGELSFTFYPEISAKDISVYGILAIIAFFALSLLPFIIEVKGDFSWKYYRSKI
ncbi:MAG: hypothetical protein II802_01505, partial [Clostridia bacterium]|nr:hypothetical protein [Clostridia bacterium]